MEVSEKNPRHFLLMEKPMVVDTHIFCSETTPLLGKPFAISYEIIYEISNTIYIIL
jgi:hypothetical protein